MVRFLLDHLNKESAGFSAASSFGVLLIRVSWLEFMYITNVITRYYSWSWSYAFRLAPSFHGTFHPFLIGTSLWWRCGGCCVWPQTTNSNSVFIRKAWCRGETSNRLLTSIDIWVCVRRHDAVVRPAITFSRPLIYGYVLEGLMSWWDQQYLLEGLMPWWDQQYVSYLSPQNRIILPLVFLLSNVISVSHPISILVLAHTCYLTSCVHPLCLQGLVWVGSHSSESTEFRGGSCAILVDGKYSTYLVSGMWCVSSQQWN